MLTLYDYLPSQNAWKVRLLATLRHWTLTGKLARRASALVDRLRHVADRALAILDRELETRAFIAGATCTIADMSLFAYVHRADEAGLALSDYPGVMGWIARVRAQPGFLGTVYPYSIDPFSGGELP